MYYNGLRPGLERPGRQPSRVKVPQCGVGSLLFVCIPSVADSDPRRNQFICAARSGRLSHDHDSRNLYRHPQPKQSSQLFVITRELERKLAFPAADWY
ncbi:hypothetical protein L1887_58086 [Cichorium endivia]|nr:hypothetical protein L1887_58086 [Cichorium endivia]